MCVPNGRGVGCVVTDGVRRDRYGVDGDRESRRVSPPLPPSVLHAGAPTLRVGDQRARLRDNLAIDLALGDLFCDEEMKCRRNTSTL